MQFLLKVCGITQEQQVIQLDDLGVDFIGFIHYKKSPRHVSLTTLKSLNKTTNATKVLVTVNESIDNIKELSGALKTKMLQLHGSETPVFCKTLREKNYKVVKAFGIHDAFDFEQLKDYQDCVDYFLFDYKGKHLGGNGIHFDWNLLDKYKLNIPYFLSGGIGLEHKEILKNSELENCFAIDVNSKFEIKPGIKNSTSLTKFIKK